MARPKLLLLDDESGNDNELDRYIADAQRYGKSLIRSGKDKEYPLLYQRMSQIMTVGGNEAAAKEWAEAQVQ